MRYILLVVALCFSFRLPGQSLYFPPLTGTVWDTLSPARFGYQQAQIDSLYQFLATKNTKAFILLRNGKVVLERYFGTFRQDSIWQWASAGKTITSMAVGIAQQEGLLSLSATTSSILGNGWSSEPLAKEQLITVRHQLTMTTGLNDAVQDNTCTRPPCLVYAADAGTRWAYHNAPYTLLDSVIQRATGQSLNAFVFTRIRNKIGMGGAFFPNGDYNNVYFSTARGMARFGLLVLNKGTWNTTRILTDTAYYRQMVMQSNPLNLSYGYLWWLNGKASYMQPVLRTVTPGSLAPNAPPDMVSGLGKDGQLLCVVPSQNLVLVRMGERPDASSGAAVSIGFTNELWHYVSRLSSPTSIKTTLGRSVIRVWPNPATNLVQLDRAVTSGTIKDVFGKSILLFSGNQFNVSTLAAGLYYVDIMGQKLPLMVSR